MRDRPDAPLEPLGLLFGRDAEEAVGLGIARWLAGGPVAFTMVRFQGRTLAITDAEVRDTGELHRHCAPVRNWAGLGPGPLVMGVLNATPDSFSDGGRHQAMRAALTAGEQMLAAGVDVIDVGGESTRPGAAPVSPDEEQMRVLPLVERLARQGAVVSVDTRNAATMAQALDAGARIVNDVSALRHDPASAQVVAERRCPVLLMHMRGTPATMGSLAIYRDLVGEVIAELTGSVARAEAAGIARQDIAIDPGLGFAKTAAQSVQLLQRLPALATLGLAIAVGLSRKSVVGTLAREPDTSRREPGSYAGALFALARGARILRVHDVPGTTQAVRVWQGMANAGPLG